MSYSPDHQSLRELELEEQKYYYPAYAVLGSIIASTLIVTMCVFFGCNREATAGSEVENVR